MHIDALRVQIETFVSFWEVQHDQLPRHADVLIVGAGPAGLALAASLAQLGIRTSSSTAARPVARVEGRGGAATDAGVPDRIDLAESLVDDGLRGRGFAVADSDPHLLRLYYGRVASPFPFLLLISQQQTEIRLADRLKNSAVNVHRGDRLIDHHDEFPGTAATLADSDECRQGHQRALRGGLRRPAQQSARLGRDRRFPARRPPTLFAVADVRARRRSDGRPGHHVHAESASGMLITSALPGGELRLVAGVPPGRAHRRPPSLDALVRERGGQAGCGDCASPRWRRAPPIACSSGSPPPTPQPQRLPRRRRRPHPQPRWRAGDEHRHPGRGATWRGSWRWRWIGRAPHDLLDSYHSERHPVASPADRVHLAAHVAGHDQRITSGRNAKRRHRRGCHGAGRQRSGSPNKLAQLDIATTPTAARRSTGRVSTGRMSKPAQGCPGHVIADESGRRVAVRPDGITADPTVLSQRYGIDLDEASRPS